LQNAEHIYKVLLIQRSMLG